MKHIICINCYHFCGKELCHIPRSFQDFADSMTYLVFNFFIFNACEVPLPSRAGKCTLIRIKSPRDSPGSLGKNKHGKCINTTPPKKKLQHRVTPLPSFFWRVPAKQGVSGGSWGMLFRDSKMHIFTLTSPLPNIHFSGRVILEEWPLATSP